jgi:hypothetical protein
MFQPAVKLNFVRRYCNPEQGWKVSVDIDASEEGWTEGARKTEHAKRRTREMRLDADRVRKVFKKMGVQVGGSRGEWAKRHGFPLVDGDRDVIAFHRKRRVCLIAEAEGTSSGQPETKLYKAIGQLVTAASSPKPSG